MLRHRFMRCRSLSPQGTEARRLGDLIPPKITYAPYECCLTRFSPRDYYKRATVRTVRRAIAFVQFAALEVRKPGLHPD